MHTLATLPELPQLRALSLARARVRVGSAIHLANLTELCDLRAPRDLTDAEDARFTAQFTAVVEG